MGRSEQFVWVEILSSYGEIRKLYATSDEKLQWWVWKVGVTKLVVKANFMPLQKQQFWRIWLGPWGRIAARLQHGTPQQRGLRGLWLRP